MGLNDLDGMDVEDNKGGRPPKEEIDDTNRRSGTGEPFMPQYDNKEWWKEKFNKFKSEENTIQDAITALSAHAQLHTIRIRKKLEEYDIYETDWAEFVEDNEMYRIDMRIRGRLREAGVDVPTTSSTKSTSSSSTTLFDDSSSSESDDQEVSGGLASMIEN